MEKNRKIAWQIAALIVVVIVIFIGIRMYEQGYRFSAKTFIAAPGTVVLTPYDSSYQIFVDGDEKKADVDGNSGRVKVSAGSHEVVVNRTGYYPWEKNVEVGSKGSISVSPFAVPASTNGAVLPKDDSKYKEAESAINATTIPTEDKPIVSKDGTIEVYVKGGAMIARVKEGAQAPSYFCNPECEKEHQVVALEAEVRGVAFFPSRNDVLLVAVQNRVFAIELDNRGTQNFQPLYDGIKPVFGLVGDQVYIKDGESIFIIHLTPAQ